MFKGSQTVVDMQEIFGNDPLTEGISRKIAELINLLPGYGD